VYHSDGHFTHETESPWPLHFKHSHWWERRSRFKFATHVRLRDQRSIYCIWMQGRCKVYMDSYRASNGSRFMLTGIIFNNHLLDVGLTQNQETMALRTLTTVGLFYFYHMWGPAWIEIQWSSIWLRTRSHMAAHDTGGSVTTLHDIGGVLGRPLGTFFWALTISWSRLLVRVWSGPAEKGQPRTLGVLVGPKSCEKETEESKADPEALQVKDPEYFAIHLVGPFQDHCPFSIQKCNSSPDSASTNKN
jgi:hypothetical protein